MKSGFTIIELVVVITVVGIVAGISVVGYLGISQNAIASSIKTDLTNGSDQLKLYKLDNGKYPTANNCASPNPPNICLTASSGNVFTYTSPIPHTSYTLVASNTNGTTYEITNTTPPVLVDPEAPTAPTAPTLSPTIIGTCSGGEEGGGYPIFTLSWTAPADDGGSAITNYKIYRGETSGGETLLTTISNVLTYIDSSLAKGRTYYYKVTAVNAINESAYSNEVNKQAGWCYSTP